MFNSIQILNMAIKCFFAKFNVCFFLKMRFEVEKQVCLKFQLSDYDLDE